MLTNNTQIPKFVQPAVMQSVMFNELRIGNYVQFSSGSVYPVDIIYKDYTMLKNWFAIPLNEEWLKMLGFKECDGCNEKNFSNGVYQVFINSLGQINYMFFEEGDFYKPIDYVHQLQNLHYMLTGAELTVA
jgi:hypothetical protein